MRGKNIARYGISLVLSLYLLSGCASKAQWTKPGFNPNEFKQDCYLCEREANILASQQAGAMSSAVNPLFIYAITKKKFYNNCMEGKGYQRFKSDEERELIESVEKPLSPSIGDQGDRWKYIGSAGKKGENYWFIDTQTISYLNKDVVRVWLKATVDEEGRLQFQHTIKSPKNLRYVFTLLDVDCQKCAHKPLKVTFYTMDGVLIDSSDFSLDEPWRPIDPGSMFMIVYREICPQKKEFKLDSSKEVEEKDWRLIRVDEEGKIYYLPKSINHLSESIITVWTKMTYTDKGKDVEISIRKEKGLPTTDVKSWNFSTALFEIDCLNKTVRLIENLIYDKQLNLINDPVESSWMNTMKDKWRHIPPETYIWDLYKHSCQ